MTTQSFLYNEADALKVSPADLCACMGPMHGEAYCDCEMERRGLPRSEEHTACMARFKAFVESGGFEELLALKEAVDCPRCSGSGEDPEGFYDQSRGPDGATHDGPCRDCGGSGAATKEGDTHADR